MKISNNLTALQKRILREIVSHVRRENRQVGEHLVEISLAKLIGASRTPVKKALDYLCQLGLVFQDPGRGYFIKKNVEEWSATVAPLLETPDDPIYFRIASDRQKNLLPTEVTEAELMRRYGVARSTLLNVLAKILEEGWIKQRVGAGWHFLPMIDSTRAYEESYLLRKSIEPAGILSPWFKPDEKQMKQLKDEQTAIVEGGYKTMTAIELFESNSQFHETLAEWSNNRFIQQTVKRVNQLRRLVEYSQASRRAPRQTQAQEHLEILNAIEKQDLIGAANLLQKHLEDARQMKVYGTKVFVE